MKHIKIAAGLAHVNYGNIAGIVREISDAGVENQVAMFLLPEGTDVGSRLKWEDFQWELLT